MNVADRVLAVETTEPDLDCFDQRAKTIAVPVAELQQTIARDVEVGHGPRARALPDAYDAPAVGEEGDGLVGVAPTSVGRPVVADAVVLDDEPHGRDHDVATRSDHATAAVRPSRAPRRRVTDGVGVMGPHEIEQSTLDRGRPSG